MDMMVLDPALQERLLAERQAWGGDRFDEVWDGVYMMAPWANNEHQDIQGGLSNAFHDSIKSAGLGRVQPGANVSDRKGEDWKDNYRCPDVVVVLNGGRAEDHGTHWFGGLDFAVPDDGVVLSSQVIPHTFRLLAGTPRPQIEVTRPQDARRWLV